MKYLVSFHTTLRVSRYLFRALTLMLWILGVLFTAFYIINVLHEKEAQIRQEFTLSYDQAQWYIRHATGLIGELKYLAEHQPVNNTEASRGHSGDSLAGKARQLQYWPLTASADCFAISKPWQDALRSLNYFLDYWRSNFVATWKLNRVFFIDAEGRCMVNFTVGKGPVDRESTLKLLHERMRHYLHGSNEERKQNIYWLSASDPAQGSGYFYMLTPVYAEGKRVALLGTERALRLKNLVISGSIPVTVTLIDQDNQVVLSSGSGSTAFLPSDIPDAKTWFGYINGYKQLIMKKPLRPSSLSILYSVLGGLLLKHLKVLIVNALLLNILSAVVLTLLAWLFERRIFLPAEDNAHRLAEHEQFNRKIVASAPVGICILRTSDGTNILSNELAHSYLAMLTQKDRQRLTEMIGGQQVNLVDIQTDNNTNLQISFVHSRYRNENVAICVLVDVSARVKMEESLQEIAQAAEQASQTKSMFLATVSHELRTPLYGIIGNLDLLQTRQLPKEVDSLVAAMNNSSSLLLKIISDILDFSKIESEQLKIDVREFSPREVLTHIASNYLPLVIKKRLTLWCFIEFNVPSTLHGDPLRLQQVISNLLSNAIKFTGTGSIVLHAYVKEEYLVFRVRDTGVGIPAKEIARLFDPFFQVGSGVQSNFQGTGLGLAICEKLINMMDGDIEVESEPGMGSQFVVRIPLWHSQAEVAEKYAELQHKRVWLSLRNDWLASYLWQLLQEYGIGVAWLAENSYAADDVVICDYVFTVTHLLRAVICFDSQHIDVPREVASGRWICSTTTPHELPALLGRIYNVIPAIPETLPVPVPEKVNNHDIQILVVDDHPINRALLSDQLVSSGYQVKVAQDGVDALTIIKRSAVDIVLTDVNMPHLDGYQLTEKLRQLGKTFPIIGVTANALAVEKQRCMEAGMDDCLAKPVTLDMLNKLLNVYASQVRRAREENQALPAPNRSRG